MKNKQYNKFCDEHGVNPETRNNIQFKQATLSSKCYKKYLVRVGLRDAFAELKKVILEELIYPPFKKMLEFIKMIRW